MLKREPGFWDNYFMGLAQYVASASKDPSTQVGAVIVDRQSRQVLGMGYNGFPRGVADKSERYADRAIKYPMVVHAEPNAILAAGGRDLSESIMYVTLFPCCDCSGIIIQSGIRELVVPTLKKDERWYDSMIISETMFREAGVTTRQLQA